MRFSRQTFFWRFASAKVRIIFDMARKKSSLRLLTHGGSLKDRYWCTLHCHQSCPELGAGSGRAWCGLVSSSILLRLFFDSSSFSKRNTIKEQTKNKQPSNESATRLRKRNGKGTPHRQQQKKNFLRRAIAGGNFCI